MGFLSKRQSDTKSDANSSALFGKRGSPAPSSDNPYAQPPPTNDPYMNDTNKFANMNPYQKTRPGGQNGQPVGLPSGPGPRNGYGTPPLSRNTSDLSSKTNPPPYANAQAPGGFGNDKYGTSSGYGASKYTNANSYQNNSRPGGYGGLGPTDSNDTDDNRGTLLSGARERHDQKQTINHRGGGASGAPAEDNKYGGYGAPRQLTEEEREHEEYRDIKNQIYETTDASVKSTQNAVRAGREALNVGMQTYARIGAQNERLHNAEQHLDTATVMQRESKAKTKELKSLNRSMFAIQMKNPFTAGRRTAEEEKRVLEQNRVDRENREETRRERFQQSARMQSTQTALNRGPTPSSFTRANRNEKNPYALEDDSDEEGAERLRNANSEIDDNVDELFELASQLNVVAKVTNQELDHGNKLIDRVTAKTEPLDDDLKLTTVKLSKIN